MFPDRVVTVATKCHKNMQKSSKSPFNMHVVDTRKNKSPEKKQMSIRESRLEYGVYYDLCYAIHTSTIFITCTCFMCCVEHYFTWP